MTDTLTYRSIEEIRQANANRGHFFFSPDTLRFFKSRVLSRVIAGRYFVTSERFDEATPRLYTVRRANDDGSVDTVGDFQGYTSARAAYAAAESIASDPYYQRASA